MALKDILIRFKSFIIVGLLLFVSFIIGFIVYKKVIKKEKIEIKKLIFYGLTICYITVVIGAVFSRENSSGSYQLHLFNSYIEAYNMMKISLFRNIILNILLFVPLGFIIPIYFKKLCKTYKVVLLGFFLSLIIELSQLMIGIGLFELDDILNNTIGVLIGYSYYKIYMNFKNKETKTLLFIYIMPTIFVILVFLSIYVIYQTQELGNFEFSPNYKINMKNADVKSEIEFSKSSGKKDIYYKKTLTEKETRKIANDMFEKLDSTIDLKISNIMEESSIYRSQNGYSMWINYIDGSYQLTYDGEDIEEEILEQTEDSITSTKVYDNKNIEDIIDYLKTININLPDGYTYDKEKREIKYDVYIDNNKKIYNGYVGVGFSNNKIIELDYSMGIYDKVKEKEIISEYDAYKKILNGDFKYYDDKIKNILIKDIKLTYYQDSKGYYIPIYEFDTLVNDDVKYIIRINAIKY